MGNDTSAGSKARTAQRVRPAMRCPICGKPSAPPAQGDASAPFPFCSERCRLIDLGRWLEGRYQIPARDATAEEQAG